MMIGNDDVVTEIISRLPTKSLCRFKCVSKPWSSFISHVSSCRKILLPISGFLVFTFGAGSCRRDYISIAPDRDRDEDRRVFESRLTNLPYMDSLTLIHCCNGLILFDRSNGDNRVYYVWNPATDEFLTLPDPPEPETYSEIYCYLAFDPRRNPHYKLVQFCDSIGEMVTVAIYSSMTGSWARRRISCPESLEDFRSRSVFHDGALHMLKLKITPLIRFNITEATFDLINLPEASTPYVWWVTTWIGESRGDLYCAFDSVRKQQLRIYMLHGESSSNWILTHTLDTESLYWHPLVSKPFTCFQLVAFNPESEVIFLDFNDKILSYHPSSGKLEETCKLSEYEAMSIGRGCFLLYLAWSPSIHLGANLSTLNSSRE